jgi:serine/threonine protein kinase
MLISPFSELYIKPCLWSVQMSHDQGTLERIALVVGIDTYPNQPLQVCTRDANEMAVLLSMPEYGFKCTTLLNTECTHKHLRQQLENLFRSVADTYLFYFSGHGWATDFGVYMVTVDSDEDDEGIDLDFLKRLITKLAPTESTVVLILDCCHAGAASPRGLAAAGVQMRAQDVVASIPFLSHGRVLIAACRGDQLAYEDTRTGHGVFTSHLLQGMLGDAVDSDGAVSVTGLYEYVSSQFSSTGMQTPVFRGDLVGKVVLGRGFVPRPGPLLSEARAVEIEREAERHLRDYQASVAPSYADLDRWKAEGHKLACQLLEPILGWFNKQIQNYPALDKRPAFRSTFEAATQRLALLCAIDIDTKTSYGQITERLGSGTFGTVWKLPETVIGAPLAYKTYHSHDLVLPEKVRRFSHGYLAMRQMDHPHIVRVHQFTNCPLGFYMDFIDGPNLRNFSGTIDDPYKNVQMLKIIGETLRHAHIRGVKHRDVKPENILVKYDEPTGEWLPYLTDFDLAWFSTASQIFTKEAMGSVYYASPEQFATPSSASAHAQTTDIYSFGQLAFFVATGSDPVPLGVADNIRALRVRLGQGWFSDAAQRFVQLYEDCTHRKPEDRPQDFAGICDRLFRIEQSLSQIASSSRLSVEDFLREVQFAMVGLGSSGQITAAKPFLSMSRKTEVTIHPRSDGPVYVDLELNFYSIESPVLEGITTFEQLRKTLYGRLDNVLDRYPSTSKRHGSSAPFQVFIDVQKLSLDLDGVATLRALISGVLDVIEGR